MASVADLALRNFKWRIESIAPTYQRPNRNVFRWIDDARIDPESTAGLLRAFNVVWMGQAAPEDGDVSDICERDSTHSFEVSLYYPTEVELLGRQVMALQDRHDIYKALRNMDNRAGYDADNTTGVVVQSRELGDDWEVDTDNGYYWRYHSVWVCRIFEPEI